MADKDPPKGDKINKNKQNKAKPKVDNDVDILTTPTTIKKLEERIKKMEISFNSRIEALHEVIDKKDKDISELNQEVGYLKSEINNLKKSTDFLSQETTDLHTQAETTKTKNQQEISDLQEKTTDLEDRGRRNNLVFFGIPETNPRETENCEARVVKEVLLEQGMIKENEIQGSLFDRVHRLGPKRAGQDRPRPIIARFSSYKDKEWVLKQDYKLKNSRFGVSEDFSKPTLQIRSELITKGKIVKDKHEFIKGYRLTYRRLSLKYENPETGNIYYRSFSLKDTKSNPNWYLPVSANRRAD